MHGALQRWWGCLVFSFYLSNFIFQSISLIVNLVDYLAASLDDHLSGEHPLHCVAKLHIRWSGHSGGFLSRLLLFIRLSIMWVEREIYCWKGNSSLWKPTSFRTLISHTWELSNHTITMPTKDPFRGEGWSFAAFSEWKSIQLRQQFWVCFCQKKIFQHIIGARFDYQTCWCWPTMQQTAWRSENQGAVYWPNQHQSTVAVQFTTPQYSCLCICVFILSICVMVVVFVFICLWTTQKRL